MAAKGFFVGLLNLATELLRDHPVTLPDPISCTPEVAAPSTGTQCSSLGRGFLRQCSQTSLHFCFSCTPPYPRLCSVHCHLGPGNGSRGLEMPHVAMSPLLININSARRHLLSHSAEMGRSLRHFAERAEWVLWSQAEQHWILHWPLLALCPWLVT